MRLLVRMSKLTIARLRKSTNSEVWIQFLGARTANRPQSATDDGAHRWASIAMTFCRAASPNCARVLQVLGVAGSESLFQMWLGIVDPVSWRQIGVFSTAMVLFGIACTCNRIQSWAFRAFSWFHSAMNRENG